MISSCHIYSITCDCDSGLILTCDCDSGFSIVATLILTCDCDSGFILTCDCDPGFFKYFSQIFQKKFLKKMNDFQVILKKHVFQKSSLLMRIVCDVIKNELLIK